MFLLPPDPTQFEGSTWEDFTLKPALFFFPAHFYRADLSAIGYRFCPGQGGKCNGKVHSIGANHKGPRRVVDMALGFYYVWASRHECSECGLRFLAYDEGALAKMPPCVRDSLPCRLSAHGGIDLDTARAVLQLGPDLGFKKLATFINEANVDLNIESRIRWVRYMSNQPASLRPRPRPSGASLTADMSALKRAADIIGAHADEYDDSQAVTVALFSIRTTLGARVRHSAVSTFEWKELQTADRFKRRFAPQPDPTYFPSATDPNWVGLGYHPVSGDYLAKSYISDFLLQEDLLRLLRIFVLGLCLKSDHTFKFAKRIVLEGGTAFKAVFAIINEYVEIVGSYWLHAKNYAELDYALALLAERFKRARASSDEQERASADGAADPDASTRSNQQPRCPPYPYYWCALTMALASTCSRAHARARAFALARMLATWQVC